MLVVGAAGAGAGDIADTASAGVAGVADGATVSAGGLAGIRTGRSIRIHTGTACGGAIRMAILAGPGTFIPTRTMPSSGGKTRF